MSFFERTYGEILDLNTLYYEIKNISQINNINLENYKFYDFGSGYGKIINFFSNIFKLSIGVEIDNERYSKSLLYDSNKVLFLNKNFFDEEIKSSCILLANNLCLGNGTNKRLSFKILKECNKNDIIILTKQLEHLKKYYLYFKTLKCTWGQSELYFYKI